jgi:hypothetical protein
MNCPEPGCTVIGYCRFHAKLNPVVKEKKVYKIPARSKKRIADQKVYVGIVARVLGEDPTCKVKEAGCNGLASGMQHKIKRSPKTFLDEDNLIPCCDSCQLWIELNPLQAIAKGYSASKYNN